MFFIFNYLCCYFNSNPVCIATLHTQLIVVVVAVPVNILLIVLPFIFFPTAHIYIYRCVFYYFLFLFSTFFSLPFFNTTLPIFPSIFCHTFSLM